MVAGYPKTRLRKRRAVQREISALLDLMRRRASNGLHLGCGPDRIDGLINCDLYDPLADRQVGVTDLTEFQGGSVDYIEAHHVIEHLSFNEAEKAVAEWARVMSAGGHIVVSCPDFDRLVRRWRNRPAERWVETIRMFYGSQEHEGMFHKSAYNAERLSQLLASHGFRPLFWYTPYPPRPTPSLLLIALKV